MTEDLVIGEDGLARPQWAASNDMLRDYYDSEWGMPVDTEAGVFERLSLECFQSGLSWAIILAKREAFREAFANFDPEKVALFTENDFNSLMDNAGIVRNKLKIRATIANAEATLMMREEGGLANFVWSFKPEQTPAPRSFDEIPTQSPESKELAKSLKKRGFKFVGPTTMFALMEAIGMVDTHLIGSHRRNSSGIWTA
ncbi:DNA-3-methyladenine glycosylase I [Glutamicibacter sp. M10]|uniref:DNA-3-methyladenine glycosylase I n=1 Tax=Glutamicibacter sp. M10 TaxID=3023076 RepID=UPI0021C8523B|nr:DNA-3-methyladenine glycosylase I [Glutamicibacter sp. M10]UXN31904.1 DNA-3-methyladenine glycosylase I [Glutamicibacter sp. M10]